MHKLKPFVYIVCITFCLQKAVAQSDSSKNILFEEQNPKFFMDFGYSLMFTNFQYTSPSADGDFMFGLNLLGGHFGFRYNFIEMHNNHAFSLGVYPALKANYYRLFNNTGFGVGSFNAPLLLEYHFGTSSTFATDIERGFSLGTGLDYNFAGFYIKQDVQRDYKRSYVQFAAKIAYHYWSRNNNARNINLHFYWGLQSNPDIESTDVQKRAFGMELVWTKYLNY